MGGRAPVDYSETRSALSHSARCRATRGRLSSGLESGVAETSRPPSSASTARRLGAGALIATPTYNESDNLEAFVRAVRDAAPGADVVIVDDASPDGTGTIADRLASEDPQVSVVHRSGKLGLGTAYVEAFSRGLQRDYGYFIEMDADQSHDPRYLPKFFQELEQGADVVIGSRNVSGGGIEGWGPARKILSKGGSLYARLVLGVRVRDLTAGYAAFTRRALEQIDLGSIESNGYSFQIEMKYRALRHGLTVVEVPIVFVDRRAGKSKLSGGVFAEAVGIVWKLRAQAVRGKL